MNAESPDEDGLVDWLKRRTHNGPRGSRIGDDCALLELEGGWAVTVDTQIEGVHFVEGSDPARVARRLLAVNLSDLAAVGARPAHAFLALSAPPGFDHHRFFDALLVDCHRFGVELSGGDLSSQPRLSAALTLMGSRIGGRFVERSAANPGHRLWLGGPAGESALGLELLLAGARVEGRTLLLPSGMEPRPEWTQDARRALRRHLVPEPQLELGAWLASRPEGAAIDVSDGLARDLHRLCRASGVGAEVDEPDLPRFSRAMAGLAEALDRQPSDLVLTGGEDYVLLFTLPPDEAPPAALRLRTGARPIGRIVHVDEDRERVRLLGPEGVRPLAADGFDHLRAWTSPGAGTEKARTARGAHSKGLRNRSGLFSRTDDSISA